MAEEGWRPTTPEELEFCSRNRVPMPEDWMPEQLLLIGRSEGVELAVALTEASLENVQASPEVLWVWIKALRQAIWQFKDHQRLHKEFCEQKALVP